MNTKKHLWNRLLTAFLIAALLLVPTVHALTTDGEPHTEGEEVTTPTTSPVDDGEPGITTDDAQDGQEPDTTPPVDDGEDSSTHETETPSEAPETAPVTVSTLEELLRAVEQAEDGAVIGLAGSIELESDTVFGSPDKTVTIQRISADAGLKKEAEEGPTSAISLSLESAKNKDKKDNKKG